MALRPLDGQRLQTIELTRRRPLPSDRRTRLARRSPPRGLQRLRRRRSGPDDGALAPDDGAIRRIDLTASSADDTVRLARLPRGVAAQGLRRTDVIRQTAVHARVGTRSARERGGGRGLLESTRGRRQHARRWRPAVSAASGGNAPGAASGRRARVHQRAEADDPGHRADWRRRAAWRGSRRRGA